MNNVSPGKLVLMIGAAVTFIFSFLPWFSASGFGYKYSASAWQSGLFPMATWAPVFAIIAGFIVAAEAFGFLQIPEKLWEFTKDQVVLVLSIFTLLVTISYLIADKSGASIGFGLILCLLGAIAMIVGFFMDKMNVGVNPNAAPAQPGFPQAGQVPPTPGGYPAQPAPQQAPPQAPQAPQAPPQAPPQQAPQAPPQAPPQQDPGAF